MVLLVHYSVADLKALSKVHRANLPQEKPSKITGRSSVAAIGFLVGVVVLIYALKFGPQGVSPMSASWTAGWSLQSVLIPYGVLGIVIYTAVVANRQAFARHFYLERPVSVEITPESIRVFYRSLVVRVALESGGQVG